VTGASFAYWDGKTLHTAVSGVRNSVTEDPVTVDTVMHIGSITKVMTATLLMQLVDEARISLDDPVHRHLPELRLRDTQALQDITCRMLVNHTSGIDGEWLPEYGPDQERIVDTIDRCAGLGQLYPPGEEASYCNIATVIAGYLVQKVRGTSWYTLIKTRIYEPLRMRHALVDPLDVPRYRASVGDLTDAATGKAVQTTRPFLSPSFAPAGSTQMATAADLLIFARALLNGGLGEGGGRIVSAASARRMMEPTAEFASVAGSSLKVGLGWMISPGGVLRHGGGGPGVRSELCAHPASGRVAALLTNSDKGEALQAALLDPLVQSWTGLQPTKAPRRLTGPVDPGPYVGTYENNADRYMIAAREGGLALRTLDKLSTFDNSNPKRPDTMLYPVGDDTFEGTRSDGSNVALRFVRPDARGQMRFLATNEHLLARAH
jgi:CubicO group peptidase (beta-lactamase class C family)